MPVEASTWESLIAAIDSGRLAHAYVVIGDPRRSGWRFTRRMIQALFCEEDERPCGACSACHRIAEGLHPDVGWIEPQSKSRRILVKQMDELIHRLQQTAYDGGYKVAGIRYADRMNEDAANKFLKTLEEPPGNSLILLLTDSPDAMLTTIRSRCQVIKVEADEEDEPEWLEELLVLLRSGRARSPLGRLSQAGYFQRLIKEIEKEEGAQAVEEAGEDPDEKVLEARVQSRVRETMNEVFRYMQLWFRDILLAKSGVGEGNLVFVDEREALMGIAERMELADCYRMIEQVEEMRVRVERNFPVIEVAEAGFR